MLKTESTGTFLVKHIDLIFRQVQNPFRHQLPRREGKIFIGGV